MNLVIPYLIQMQVNYLLKRFQKTEWSGPAWYKKEKNQWTLIHFKPIDLGSSAATEFDGKSLLKTMKEIQKTVDLTGCVQGIIHSHHNLGAFHSGTDDTELKDGANKVGYPSLVVAHTGDTHAFKYSYEDQFGNVHLEEEDVEIEMPEYQPENHWVKEADFIEKEAKSKPMVQIYNGNQGSIWNGATDGSYMKRYNGWGHYVDPEDIKYNKAYEKMQKATKLHDKGKITDKQFEKAEEEWEKVENEHFGVY